MGKKDQKDKKSEQYTVREIDTVAILCDLERIAAQFLTEEVLLNNSIRGVAALKQLVSMYDVETEKLLLIKDIVQEVLFDIVEKHKDAQDD